MSTKFTIDRALERVIDQIEKEAKQDLARDIILNLGATKLVGFTEESLAGWEKCRERVYDLLPDLPSEEL